MRLFGKKTRRLKPSGQSMTPCCEGLPTIQPVTVSPELAPDPLGWSCGLPSETDRNAEHIPCPNQRRVAGSPADGEFRSAPKVLNRMNQAIFCKFTLTYLPCQCQGERRLRAATAKPRLHPKALVRPTPAARPG